MKWKSAGDSSEDQLNSPEIQTLSVTAISLTAKLYDTKQRPVINGHFQANGTPKSVTTDDDSEDIQSNGNHDVGKQSVRTLSNSTSDYHVNGHAKTNGFGNQPEDRYTTVEHSSSNFNSVVPISIISNENGQSCVDGGFPHFATLQQLRTSKTDPFYRSERRRLEWWLILISISLGLGNFWRFPNIAYENEGGSFVFAYLIVQIVVAQPLCFLELSMGQFTSGGIATSWRCFPLLKGLWVSQKTVTLYLAIYLGVVSAVAMHQGYSFFGVRYHYNPLNTSYDDNFTTNSSDEIFRLEDFYNLTDDEDKFHLNKVMVSFLAAIWILVFVCIFWSKITRRAFYVTSTIPIICLVALLIFTLTQDGSLEGIKTFFKPKWDSLADVRIWYAAVGQSFFSLSVGFGHLIIFSQFNDFKHNVFRDSVLICLVDTVTSLVAGSLVFASLNNFSRMHNLSEPIPNFPGVGISFFAYTVALSRIDNDALYKICFLIFFVSIYALGISTLVPVVDSIPNKSRYEAKNAKKKKLVACFLVCLLSFIVGIGFSSGFLSYLMVAVDRYAIELGIIILSAIECGGIMWGYGVSKFSQDMAFMREKSLSIWWKVIWSCLAPVGLLVLTIWWHCLDEDIPLVEGHTPRWSKNTGYCLFAFTMLQLPLFIWKSFSQSDEYGFKRKLRGLVREESFWGPSDPHHRYTWLKKRDGVSPSSNPSSASSTLRRQRQEQHEQGRDNEAFEDDTCDERL